MKMKISKLITILLCIVLTLSCAICLFSCGEEEEECAHESVGADGKCTECGEQINEPETDDGELLFVKNGAINFQFVIASGVGGDAILKVDELIRTINSRTDGGLERVSDAKDNQMDFEVLVGSVKNRGDKYNFNGRDYGYNGYAIKLIDNKIIVVGGSDDSLIKAIDQLLKKVIDLPKGSGKIDNLGVNTDGLIEKVQDDYNVNKILVDGNDASTYSIAYGTDSEAKKCATDLQELLYLSTGYYLPTVRLEKLEGNAIIIDVTKGQPEKRTDDGFIVYVDDDKNLVVESDFPNRIYDTAYTFFYDKIESAKNKRLSFDGDFEQTVNVRDIYYADFGAKGNGIADDFDAILAAHEYANQYGHRVNSDGANKTYYIGTGHGSASIIVMTDTYWHGCKFIFDDYDIAPTDPERKTPIFTISSSGRSYSLSGATLPVTSLYEKDTTIGDWAPGTKVLVRLLSNSQRHFIRYGENQGNGDAQTEILLIKADGTIDESTPIQWDYEELTKIYVYPADDEPITVSGGSPGDDDSDINNIKRAVVETIFNDAPSEYTYYSRNIFINRSNVVLKNIEHELIGDDEREHSAPYSGFTQITLANNVVVSGFIFEAQVGFSTIGAGGVSVGMGSYEIAASYSSNILWRDSYQKNFFEPDGSVTYDGTMGTNYCKSLNFDNMFTCSFDAHCGTYNATIRNSTIEHLNFIGEGKILIENVTMYTDGSYAAMIFRSDYGSTWQGEVEINGLTMKTSKSSPKLSLIKAVWTNHYFGYTTYLPYKITMNDVKIVQYSFGIDPSGNRWEDPVKENHVPLHIYGELEKYTYYDLSDPNASHHLHPNDYKKCNCSEVYANLGLTNNDGSPVGFNDTDGDGRCNNKADPTDKTYDVWCWGFENEPDKLVNANPYVPTEEIYVTNCGNLQIIVPDTPQFEDTKLYVEGKLVE